MSRLAVHVEHGVGGGAVEHEKREYGGSEHNLEHRGPVSPGTAGEKGTAPKHDSLQGGEQEERRRADESHSLHEGGAPAERLDSPGVFDDGDHGGEGPGDAEVEEGGEEGEEEEGGGGEEDGGGEGDGGSVAEEEVEEGEREGEGEEDEVVEDGGGEERGEGGAEGGEGGEELDGAAEEAVEDAVGDGGEGAEGEEEKQEGQEEEWEGKGEIERGSGGMGLGGEAEEGVDAGGVGRGGEEVEEGGGDDEGEGEGEEEDDGEGEEVTGVGVDDALRFREDRPQVEARSTTCHAFLVCLHFTDTEDRNGMMMKEKKEVACRLQIDREGSRLWWRFP